MGLQSVLSTAASAVSDAAKAAAEAWLDSTLTAPSLHWANIKTGAVLMGTNQVTGIRRFVSGGISKGILTVLTAGEGVIENFINTGVANSSAMQAIATFQNAVTDELKDPNIEGIPIHAESEQENKDVEVNKQIVIVQSSMNKDVKIDNATPQLRTWSIRGYLMSGKNDLDPFLVIKPTLKLQRKLLNWYADSRRPVWFKTHDGDFQKVLITHIDTAYDPKALNALLINVTLTEFKVMEIASTTASAIALFLKGE